MKDDRTNERVALKDEVVEQVARALCWKFTEETDDCSSECMNAKRCMAEKVGDSFVRDARAAIEAYESIPYRG